MALALSGAAGSSRSGTGRPRRPIHHTITIFVGAILLASSGVVRADPSPATWDAETRERLFDLNGRFGGDKAPATGASGAIAGTTGAPANYAGLEVLEAGGTAADAVVATALMQIALAQGSWVSYAGIWTMVYYEAATGRIHNLNAAYNTVVAETDPMTIPAEASGRTALVPGFMAGAEATHRRFGKLPWGELFEPAVYVADEGFVLHSLNAAMIERRKDVLSRFPESKALFAGDDGSWYGEGDLFVQHELAATLRAVAAEGASYMYEGAWAEKLVDVIRADGGRLSMDDMRAYEVIWSEPLVIDYGQFEIHAHGLPAQGGIHLAETLNLAQEADLAVMGRYTESAETLFWLAQFTDQFFFSFLPAETLAMMYPGIDMSYAARGTREHARIFWSRMREGSLPAFPVPKVKDPRHSDAIVAVDRWGNVAAVVHTINTSAWGATGIFVDGVSIPDSASFQQQLIAATGPGARLPDPTEPLIVLRDGDVYAALSSIGAGLHQKSTTVLLNLLDYGLGLKASVDAASIHLPDFGDNGERTQTVYAGEFADSVLAEARSMGLAINIREDTIEQRGARGYVVGVAIDPDTGARQAVVPRMFNAEAQAY